MSIETRIDPAFGTAEPAVWWYQAKGQPEGPVTGQQVQALLKQGSIMESTTVWRQEFGPQWKPLDQTALWSAPPATAIPSLNMAGAAHNDLTPTSATADPQPIYNPKWQPIFDAAASESESWNLFNRKGVRHSSAERMASSWRLYSLPGFLFGPFYYFYLRMWRKGVLLLALLPIGFVIGELTSWTRFTGLLLPVMCAILAKRDYYKFCVKGEAVWPFLSFSKNVFTDLGSGLID